MNYYAKNTKLFNANLCNPDIFCTFAVCILHIFNLFHQKII